MGNCVCTPLLQEPGQLPRGLSARPENLSAVPPYNCVLPLDVYRKRPGDTQSTLVESTCFLLNDRRLLDNRLVCTAAHSLVLENDMTECGPIVRIELRSEGQNFELVDPLQGFDFVCHPRWHGTQAVHNTTDVALLQLPNLSVNGVTFAEVFGTRGGLPFVLDAPNPGELTCVVGRNWLSTAELLPRTQQGLVVVASPSAQGSSGGPWLNENKVAFAVHTSSIGYHDVNGNFVSLAGKGIVLDDTVLNDMMETLLV